MAPMNMDMAIRLMGNPLGLSDIGINGERTVAAIILFKVKGYLAFSVTILLYSKRT
jgi:hypothetical protein